VADAKRLRDVGDARRGLAAAPAAFGSLRDNRLHNGNGSTRETT
jgi:hypothetical protein